MKAIFRIFVTILLLAGWTIAAMSLYVVRTPDKIGLITKMRLLDDPKHTYTDTRAWTLDDVAKNPQVVEQILHSGKAELLKHVVPITDGRSLESVLREAMSRGSVAKR